MKTEKLKTFLATAMETQKRDDDTTYQAFNEETEFKTYWSEIKDILFRSDFKINDFHYETLSEAFSSILCHLEDGNLLKNHEVHEHSEADIHTYSLLQWLQDDVYNVGYVDEVMQEMECKNFIQTLQHAQQRAKTDIYQMAVSVIEYLAGLDA